MLRITVLITACTRRFPFPVSRFSILAVSYVWLRSFAEDNRVCLAGSIECDSKCSKWVASTRD